MILGKQRFIQKGQMDTDKRLALATLAVGVCQKWKSKTIEVLLTSY